MSRPIRVYVHSLGHSLDDLLRCHRERYASAGPAYMGWCRCAAGANGSSAGSYGDVPWLRDMRGGLAAELFMHAALARPSGSHLGDADARRVAQEWNVHRSDDPNHSDLFFIPLFAALSFTLSEARVTAPRGPRDRGACSLATAARGAPGGATAGLEFTSHESRMMRAVEAVSATAAFRQWPHRHFVVGAAELAPCAVNFGPSMLSLRPNLNDAATARMLKLTKQVMLVNMERAWHVERYFRAVVLAPYAAVNELLGSDVRLRVDREAFESGRQQPMTTRRLPSLESETTSRRLPSPEPSPARGAFQQHRHQQQLQQRAEQQVDRTALKIQTTAASSQVPSVLTTSAVHRPLLVYFRGSSFGAVRHSLMTALLRHVYPHNYSGSNRSYATAHAAAHAAAARDAAGHASTWSNASRGDVVIEYGGKFAYSQGYAASMLSSTFCLTPSGHTCTTRRYFDAVAAGCIPVRTDCLSKSESQPFLLTHGGIKGRQQGEASKQLFTHPAPVLSPVDESGVAVFPHQVDHRTFSIAYPSSAIVRDPGSLLQHLRERAMQPGWLASMRRNLSHARSRLLYAYSAPTPTSPPMALAALGAATSDAARLAPDPTSSSVILGGAVRCILDELLRVSQQLPF